MVAAVAPITDTPDFLDAWQVYRYDLTAAGKSVHYLKKLATLPVLLATYGFDIDGPLDLVLTPARLRAFMLECSRDHKPTSINWYGNALKSFGRWCTDEELLAENPLDRVKIPRKSGTLTPFLTTPEVQALLDTAAAIPTPIRDRAVILFMVGTGVRVEECAQLRWSQLDVDGHRALIRNGKGDKARTVRFGTIEAKALAAWQAVAQSAGPVFGLGSTAIRYLLGRISKRAGIRHVAPHMLRVTFATNYLRAHPGAINQLRLLLGHETLEMTLRYARLVDADTDLPGPSGAEFMGLH